MARAVWAGSAGGRWLGCICSSQCMQPSTPAPPPSPTLPHLYAAGSDSSVPSTVEAQLNARNTSDLLRRFRELGERMRQEYQAPPVLGEEETKLRVCVCVGGGLGWAGVVQQSRDARLAKCHLHMLPDPAYPSPCLPPPRSARHRWRSMRRSWRRRRGAPSTW